MAERHLARGIDDMSLAVLSGATLTHHQNVKVTGKQTRKKVSSAIDLALCTQDLVGPLTWHGKLPQVDGGVQGNYHDGICVNWNLIVMGSP